MNRLDRVELFGAALHQQIREPGSDARQDHRGAIFFLESFLKTKLLGLEGIAGQVRGHVEIVRAEMEGRAQDDLVEHGRRGVHQQVAAARRAHDGAHIPRVDDINGDRGIFAQEAAGSLRVAVAAADGVPLAFKQLSQQGTGGPGSDNEDAHRGPTLA